MENAAALKKEMKDISGVREEVDFSNWSKRTWWMPWQSEAMKDVLTCDKP